jgi:hypothetical protein
VVLTIRERWNRRFWRYRSRLAITQLWQGAGVLERLRRDWQSKLVEFNSGVNTDDEGRLLFGRDMDEFDAVRGLDLSLLQASLEHSSARLDNRSLVLATAGGALGGAAFGALAGALTATVR